MTFSTGRTAPPAGMSSKRLVGIFRPAPIAGVLFLFVPLFLAAACGRSRPPDLTIIHTNDLKGYILPVQVRGWNARTGGYAVFASWVEEVRAENRGRGVPTLLLDSGNIFYGTPEGHFRKGEAVVDLMNRVGYDATAIGAGDFEFGYLNLVRLSGRADFPFLAANVHRRGSAAPADFAQACLVREVNGVRVGLFGLTTGRMERDLLPGDLDRLDFREPASAARECVESLRARGADLVVALSRLGLEENLALARRVEGIDVIIGGHGSRTLRRPVRKPGGGTLVYQLEGYGRSAGRIDLWLGDGADRVRRHRYEVFVNQERSRPHQLEIDSHLAEIRRKTGGDWDRVLGLALQNVTSKKDGESPLGNLVADAIRRSAAVEVAFHDPGAVKAPLLEGNIVRRDVFHVLPENRVIVAMDVKGSAIRRILEESLDPATPFLQVSGLTARYDPSLAAGERLLGVEIGASPLEDESYYRVAVTDALAMNPVFSGILREGINWRMTGLLVREALADLIGSREPIFFGTFRPTRMVRAGGQRSRQAGK